MLGDMLWFTSLDYRTRQTSLAIPGQASLSSDALYHYVISAKDPGVPNWLHAAGHPYGCVFVRWQGLEQREPGDPVTKVAEFARVREELPDDEPIVTEHQRRTE
jgi:hypothetical protein